VAAAVDAARRLFIHPPTARDRGELLALNVASRHRLRPWIEPMTSGAAPAAYVRRADFRRAGFSRRYLKIFGRRRDHERWAITAEDRRR
jgi:hypothetical protein